MSQKPRRTIVLAPSYEAFVRWCRDEGLDPRDRTIHAATESTLRRMRGWQFDTDLDRFAVAAMPLIPWQLWEHARAVLIPMGVPVP